MKDKDLSELKFEPLGKHERAVFTCENTALTDYIKKQASQDVSRNAAAVYVATLDGKNILGYYTLSHYLLTASVTSFPSAEWFQDPPKASLPAFCQVFRTRNPRGARSLLEMGLPLRWFIACLLLALAAGAMVFNKMTVCSWMRQKNPAATISIVGGCLGAAGCLTSPLPWLNKAWWLPCMLDVLGAPYLLILAWLGLERWLKMLEK